MIPLAVRLRRETHRKIAAVQDLIVEEAYRHFERAVLHGGTAIWRCYRGRRFSEDVDFYLTRDEGRLRALFASLGKRGLRITKKKIGERSVYSELEVDRTAVRLEATFQKVPGHLADYEKGDGMVMAVYSLTPEELLAEKVSAYVHRRKVRDLYDIFFLLRLVKDTGRVKTHLAALLAAYRPPIDEKDLKAIIIEGIVPSAAEMVEYIKRTWENANT